MADAVDQFHVGHEADSRRMNLGDQSVHFVEVDFLRNVTDRPRLAVPTSITDAICAKVNHAPGRDATDRVVADDAGGNVNEYIPPLCQCRTSSSRLMKSAFSVVVRWSDLTLFPSARRC